MQGAGAGREASCFEHLFSVYYMQSPVPSSFQAHPCLTAQNEAPTKGGVRFPRL